MDDTPIFGRREVTTGIGNSYQDLLDEQAAEIERLSALLKPLAGIALWSDTYPDCEVDHVVDSQLSRYFTVDQIKAARAAI